MTKKKLCPYQGFKECLEEKCGIWSVYHDECSFQALSEIPRKLWLLLRLISKACNVPIEGEK